MRKGGLYCLYCLYTPKGVETVGAVRPSLTLRGFRALGHNNSNRDSNHAGHPTARLEAGAAGGGRAGEISGRSLRFTVPITVFTRARIEWGGVARAAGSFPPFQSRVTRQRNRGLARERQNAISVSGPARARHGRSGAEKGEKSGNGLSSGRALKSHDARARRSASSRCIRCPGRTSLLARMSAFLAPFRFPTPVAHLAGTGHGHRVLRLSRWRSLALARNPRSIAREGPARSARALFWRSGSGLHSLPPFRAAGVLTVLGVPGRKDAY